METGSIYNEKKNKNILIQKGRKQCTEWSAMSTAPILDPLSVHKTSNRTTSARDIQTVSLSKTAAIP